MQHVQKETTDEALSRSFWIMAVRSAMVKPSRRRQSTALVIISGTTNSQKKRKLHTIKKH